MPEPRTLRRQPAAGGRRRNARAGWRRVVLAFLAACGLTLGLLTVTTAPAAAAFHDCKQIGAADQYGNYASMCVDLYTDIDGDFAYGSNDISCWAPGNKPLLVECAGIHEQPGTCSGYLTTCNYGVAGVCGVRFGHSACGIRRVVNYAPDILIACGYDYWAITIGTSVVLPQSGKTVSGGLVGRHWRPC